MDQRLRAVEMFEKSISQAFAFVRPFDQSRHVGNDEAAVAAERDDAEVRSERGEGVIGNLRTRRRDTRDQRGLSRIWKSDQTDVGKQLQVELQQPGLAGGAFFAAARRTIGRAGEARVPAAADAALRNENTLAGLDEI